jgi:peptide/nickel transport system substrate-binding protein
MLEPDLAERWEQPDDTTVVFYLRKGVRWQNKPPVNGRELTAEDVKFTFDRFLTEKGNPLRFMLDPVDRVDVVDRYTVRFRLKEPFVWLVQMLANPSGTWIVPREVVEKYGDLKKPETAIGTGPFVLERYEPNVKTVFKRNPTTSRRACPPSTAWSGPSWRTRPPGSRPIARDSSTAAHGTGGPCASTTSMPSGRASRIWPSRTSSPT